MTGLEGIGKLHNVFVGFVVLSTIVELASLAVYHLVIKKEKIENKALNNKLTDLIITYNLFYILFFLIVLIFLR